MASYRRARIIAEDEYYHNKQRRTRQSLLDLSDEHPLQRALLSSPAHLTPDSQTRASYDIVASREVVASNGSSFIINGIGVRALNALFHLQEEKEEWVPSSELYEIFYSPAYDSSVQSVTLLRGIETLEQMRYATDRGGELIERSARGAGSRPSYRIHPEVGFADMRDPGRIYIPTLDDMLEQHRNIHQE